MRKIHYILLGMKYTLLALLILFASLLIITNIYKFDIFDFSIYGATTLGLFFLFYYFDKIIWAVESRPRTGSESMPGKEGIAITDINNEGEVRVEGIIWHARSYNGKIINKGERVIVEGVEGIILIVRKI
ncbi:MAG: hypothetical protein JHC29_03275 [Thermoplasmata archaeon]|jgi:membrane-bound serine protease (ClpP class)|nr:hypothetical protein [Thermoplasmata archaeon]MVT12766.1 hypothetical protein [Euryarchaeota archaeon]